MTPLVIGHRGASGRRPEHTSLAYRMAYRLGADSVETDLVVTRDGHLICRHDLELSRTTDIADRPEFASRRRVVSHEGTSVRGWFAFDLDLDEIATLKVRERHPKKRPESARYDGKLGVLTFEALLNLRDEESARAGRPLGLHVELKEPGWHRSLGLPVGELALSALAGRSPAGVSLMSFGDSELRALSERTSLPLIRLVELRCRTRELDRISEYASGVGAHKLLVLRPGRSGSAAQPRPGKIVRRAHVRGLDLHVWTLKREDPAAYVDAGVDGLITDFPGRALGARRASVSHVKTGS